MQPSKFLGEKGRGEKGLHFSSMDTALSMLRWKYNSLFAERHITGSFQQEEKALFSPFCAAGQIWSWYMITTPELTHVHVVLHAPAPRFIQTRYEAHAGEWGRKKRQTCWSAFTHCDVTGLIFLWLIPTCYKIISALSALIRIGLCRWDRNGSNTISSTKFCWEGDTAGT